MNQFNYLHENVELFIELLNKISADQHIENTIVEKDYYVTLFLKEFVQKQPYVIFKGGTSLSKCFKVINRFSEDIDLNYGIGKHGATEGQRKKMAHSVVEIIKKLNFDCTNQDLNRLHSKAKFLNFKMDYHSVCYGNYIDFMVKNEKTNMLNMIQLETSYFIPSFPVEKRLVSSIVYDSLKKLRMDTIINTYHLEPFEIITQSIIRTFIDKVFAICDYYIQDQKDIHDYIAKHSRHLYDIHKLYPLVIDYPNLKKLIIEVNDFRKGRLKCFCSYLELNVSEVLYDIVEKNVYKSDYEQMTIPFLYEDVEYEDTIETLLLIADSRLFSILV